MEDGPGNDIRAKPLREKQREGVAGGPGWSRAAFGRHCLTWSHFLSGAFFNQECLSSINSPILHNSSGYAFSSLLFIFLYAMMEMEYLGSAEFSNYGTNWFRTGGRRSRARTFRVWKNYREKVFTPVSPICTQVYSKYPNGVRPSTIWEKGGKSLFSLVSEK